VAPGTGRVAPGETPRNEAPSPPPAPRLVLAALDRPVAEKDNPDLAVKAVAFLKTYCYGCHGERFEVEGYDVLKRNVLVAPREGEDRPYVTPGDPDQSEMWIRAGVEKSMPPKKAPQRPTDAERTIL